MVQNLFPFTSLLDLNITQQNGRSDDHDTYLCAQTWALGIPSRIKSKRPISSLARPGPRFNCIDCMVDKAGAVGEHGRYKQVELDIHVSELTSRLESRDVVTRPAPNRVQDVRRRAQETGAGPQGG